MQKQSKGESTLRVQSVKMNKKTIYIIRHGETDMNLRECLQGQIDSELNENGIKEAGTAAENIRNAGIVFDIIYSSPLKRAMKTAQIIADGREVIAEPLIKEMRFGHYEGMPYKSIDSGMWAFIRDPENTRPPADVESIKSLTDRTGRFLRRVLNDSSCGNILAVSHGIALRSMLWNVFPPEGRHKVWSMPIENCVVYRIEAVNSVVTSVSRADELSQKNESDTSAAF